MFNANSAIFSAISWQEQVIYQWDDDEVRFVLDRSWIFIVLAHWNNSLQVDMSLHSDTLFWFLANQSLLFLLNAAFLAEKQQTSILYSFVWQDRSSYPQSIALEASTLTITLPMQFPIFFYFYYFFNQNFLLSFNKSYLISI